MTATRKKKSSSRDEIYARLQHRKALELLAAKSESGDLFKMLLAVRDTWRGMPAVPPGSFLEGVLTAFAERTDIPLEIPFSAVMSFLSAELLHRGVTINFDGRNIYPDIWTIVLAESGSSKTYATSRIKDIIEFDNSKLFDNPSSAAKFVDLLVTRNHTLWLRDEFAQLLHQIDNQSYMAELKDYMLQLYDNETISRETVKKSVVVPDAALTIHGTTVFSTFRDKVSNEAMLDGFAQRFAYVYAPSDPARPMQDYPLYKLQDHVEPLRRKWKRMSNVIHDNVQYTLSDDAVSAFERHFTLLFNDSGSEVPPSFYRRVLYRSIKYALIYHVLIGNQSTEIDEVDMSWAARLAQMQLVDLRTVIGDRMVSDLGRVVNSVEALSNKIRDRDNRNVTARDIVMNVNAIKNVNEARAIMKLIGISEAE